MVLEAAIECALSEDQLEKFADSRAALFFMESITAKDSAEEIYAKAYAAMKRFLASAASAAEA